VATSRHRRLAAQDGLAKADKKASRVAAEGRIAMAQDGGKAVLVEINSETDFVAKDDNFLTFANAVAQTALASARSDAEALKAPSLASGDTVDEARAAVDRKVGENVQVRRLAAANSANNRALRPRRPHRRAGRGQGRQRRAGPRLAMHIAR
jgi:elongation factor Ts